MKNVTAKPTVLVVDDERNIRRTLEMVLDGEGYSVHTAESAEQGLALVDRVGGDILFLDVKLPGIDGLTALPLFRERRPLLQVIMISGHATLHDAVEATRLGAFDFLQKPLDRDRLLITMRNAAEKFELALELSQLRSGSAGFSELVGKSAVMQRLYADIEKVAPSRAFVLIAGESGTGKELIARSIHKLSPRSSGPFIKVNCAAIPSELIESELFGHERGSFTGADRLRRGQFELAHAGTLFLDEIADMSLNAQAKVLRVLQTGEVSRVGSEKVFHVDVRVISATNKDLKRAVERGEFREDLYFRLNVVPLESPPLCERGDDILQLVDHFARQYCRENDLPVKAFAADVLEKLRHYRWPGNVRELKNLVERLIIMGGNPVGLDDLPESINERSPARGWVFDTDETLREFRDRIEREFIIHRLTEEGWNVSRAALSLGIERTNLHKKLKHYGISRTDEPDA
ncbi:MAG: sigma-54-dependent Fis family transcriptional regulator [Myxococcales bacterium]|nr:sigma-54-dependent Fis family transcriptional regulator [Myxococcales bacterium]